MNVLIPEDLLARRAARGELVEKLKRNLCIYNPSPGAAADLIDSWFSGEAQRVPKRVKTVKRVVEPATATTNAFPQIVQPILTAAPRSSVPVAAVPAVQPTLPIADRATRSFTIDLATPASDYIGQANNPATKLLQQLETRWKHVRAPETVRVTVTLNSLTIKNHKTLVHHEIPLMGSEPHTALTAVAPPWYNHRRMTFCTAVACCRTQEVIVWVFDLKRAMLIGRWERPLAAAQSGIGKIVPLKNGMLALVSGDHIEIIHGGDEDYSTKMELWAEVHVALYDVVPASAFEFLPVGSGPVVCIIHNEQSTVVGEIHKGGQSCWWKGELDLKGECGGMQFDKFIQVLTLHLARNEQSEYLSALRSWYRALTEDARVHFLVQEFLPAWKDHCRGCLTAARWMTEEAWGLALRTVLLEHILVEPNELVGEILQCVEENAGERLNTACIQYAEHAAGSVEYDTTVQACLELFFSKNELRSS